MADDGWQKVREIFDSALGRKPEERRKFVREACAGDEILLAEVESLLSSLDSADSFMEAPAVAEVAEAFGSDGHKLDKGQCLRHYEIIEQVGSGGMGEVYLAKDKTLDRQVAIKVLNQEFSQHDANLQRFIHEAKAASALNHPNILTIYEFGEAENAHFIVSEFIEGETLREVIRESRLGFSEILDISIQVAAALSAAHKAHLIHRDIKPENIMIRPDGYVKILDFGLAKLIQPKQAILGLEVDTARQNETAKGVIMGTVNYMSPEQAKGERVDERTDSFSFGVLIYEMLTGRTPFSGDSISETFANLIKTEPPPLSQFASNVPDELQRVVSKTLRKDKAERYQTMNAVLTDLRHLRENMTLEEKLERAVPPTGGDAVLWTATGQVNKETAETQHIPYQRISRQNPLVIAALVASLVGVLAFGYWFYANRFSSRNQIESIAVLPFQNSSGDVNLDYLSDGLSESIIDRLSGLPQLKVIARNSSFKFRGQDDWQQAATAMGVRAIVTGRIMLDGNSLTVRVELVDVRENRQLWSQQYIRQLTDAPVVQEEITQTISEKLSLNLSGAQMQQIAQYKTVNPQAFEFALKGRFYSFKGGAENWKQAVEYFEQAIATDPNYAPAYAGLFWAYRNLLTRGVLNAQEFGPKAAAAARKALELDPNLADANLALAYMRRDAWNWPEAETSYKRAIELGPNLAPARGAYSAYLSVLGRHAEAIPEATRAADLDPFSPFFKTNAGFVLFLARRYDEAIETLQKTLELDRNHSNAHLILGLVYTEKGMFAEAIAAHEEAVRIDKISPNLRIAVGTAYARSGNREQAQKIFNQLRESQSNIPPTDLAVFYAAMGERDLAFASLEQAFAAHDSQLQYLGTGPAYDSLRDDPRFDDLARRVGLK